MNESQTSLKAGQLATLAANALYQLFIEVKSDVAKDRFRTLKKSDSVTLGNLDLGNGTEVMLRLSLDCTEYVGKLNYQTFRKFVELLLQQFKSKLDSNAPLNLMNDESGTKFLFKLPASLMEGNTLNVMMLGVITAVEGELGFQLMFMDPDQFKSAPDQRKS